MVDDVISQFKGSLDLWPTLIEICYYAKSKKAFPQVQVLNKTSNRFNRKTSSKPRLSQPASIISDQNRDLVSLKKAKDSINPHGEKPSSS